MNPDRRTSSRRLLRWVAIAVVMLVFLLIGWSLTNRFGVPDVQEHVRDRLTIGLARDGLILLDQDPEATKAPKRLPWCFAGNASSPLPFVVAIDAAYAVAPTAGQRSREYFLWLFGLKIHLRSRLVWTS